MTIKTVWGGANLNPTIFPGGVNNPAIPGVFAALKEAGVTTIDVARLYEGAEEFLGQIPDRTSFTVDTKLPGGFVPGTLTKENILAHGPDSLAKVKIPQFDILYIHAPDDSVSLEEALEAINEVHKKGIFRRFGLSNFSVEQVQAVYDLAKEKGFVLPTVYQSNYNPVARANETELFPTLRKLGIAIYAYSPVAGGFLTKSVAEIDAGAGRFNEIALGGFYNRLYNKPSLRAGLKEWNEISQQEGVSPAELAYRWVAHNSALKEELGDALIIGSRTAEQILETTGYIKKGGLSKAALEKIDHVWETAKEDDFVDNYKGSRGWA